MQNVNRILSQIIQISIIQNECIKYNTEHFYLVDKTLKEHGNICTRTMYVMINTDCKSNAKFLKE